MYCIGKGSSSPRRCIAAACIAGSTPRSPIITSMGSPGIRWMSANARIVMPMKVGITIPMRRKTNRNMCRPYGLDGGKTQPATRARDPVAGQFSTSLLNRAKNLLRVIAYRTAVALLHADAVKAQVAERFDAHVGNFLAHRLIDRRVCDRRERQLFREDLLRLHIKLRACILAIGFAALLHEFVERLVTPLREVIAVHRIAAEQRAEPVVRIAVVA